jgi:hypothetical protein
MKYRNLTTIINDTDIKPVFLTILSGVIGRHAEELQAISSHIQSHVEGSEVEEIFKNIVEVNRLFNKTNHELENLAAVALLLKDDSPTDTEVLKDLPDLEKNGLGVSGGSE